MSWINRKPTAKTNEFGVIPVLFHIACNLVGEHGTVRVSSRKHNLRSATVSFFLPNHAEAPAFTPRLFMEIEAAAESQGYVLHELVSYVRLMNASGEVPRDLSPAAQSVIQAPTGYQSAQHRPAYQHQSVMASGNFGSIHHNEVSGDEGAEVLRRAGTIQRTEHREAFNVHSLNGDFSNLDIPAFMRKDPAAAHLMTPAEVQARFDANVAAFATLYPTGWMLNAAEVDRRCAGWPQALREEFTHAVAIYSANKLEVRPMWKKLNSELSDLIAEYQQQAVDAVTETTK